VGEFGLMRVRATMPRWTRRPLNQCRRCGRTWYPRGANLSRQCPACGSGDVELPIMGCLRALAVLVVLPILVAVPLVQALGSLVGAVVRQVGPFVRSLGVRVGALVRRMHRQTPKTGGKSDATAASPLRTKAPFRPRFLGGALPSSSRYRSWVERIINPVLAAVRWVASVNDDLVGTTTSHPAIVVAKLAILVGSAVCLVVVILKVAG
jgi:hypothetical protein